MITDEELRVTIKRALFEGANPRGFTGDVKRVYAAMLAEQDEDTEE